METFALEVCPVCQRKAAPQFMSHREDGTQICLECFHKEKSRKPTKVAYDETNLKSESKSAGIAMKVVGSLLAVMALLVGGICIFYHPSPTQPLAKAEGADAAANTKHRIKHRHGEKVEEKEDADQKDDKTADADPNEASDKADQQPAEAKDPKNPNVVASATAAGGKTERMAPTVQALVTNLPKTPTKPGGPTGAPVPAGITKLVDEADAAAAALKGAQGPEAAKTAALHPNEKTKEKAEETKAAALAVATALIDKNDKDGTKSADALAKLGGVSTAFADVAEKLAPPAPLKSGSGGSGGFGNNSTGSTRLEADVLETQGRAGYDPLEAVRRESEDAAPGASTVKVEKDPNAPQPKPETGSAAGPAAGNPTLAPTDKLNVAAPYATAQQSAVSSGSAGAPGTAQNNTALAMASLPSSTFTAAQTLRGAVSATPSTTFAGVPTAQSPQAAQPPVVFMSMRGDLLFGYNSAALRPEAETQLAEVARVLSTHPGLPVIVRGYTDSKGSPTANHILSTKRAESVRDWLVGKLGAQVQNITVQGMGAADPAQPNRNPNGSDNPTGRERNRRVTVTIPETHVTQPPVSAFHDVSGQGLRADAR